MKIAENKELCEKYMGKFPVISISLKNVEVPDNRTGIVIELKYAEDGNMDAASEKALQQIEDRDYAAKLKDDGMRNIIKYGIACYKKNCKVVLG